MAPHLRSRLPGGLGHRRRPAAGQQLSALQALTGGSLFTQTPTGVEATPRGRELYGQVAEALDHLEGVLAALDGRQLPEPAVIRIGASAEYATLRLVPALAGMPSPARLRLGDDAELVGLLEAGELDLACLPRLPQRRDPTVTPLPPEPFVLVAALALASPPEVVAEPHRLGEWLAGRPWVAVSV